jgi:hypothetical protein
MELTKKWKEERERELTLISFSSIRLKSLFMSITMGEKIQSKLDNNRKNL